MATEYKLSYTAEEINEKLGQIGNDKAIVDITELPTEGVNESSFYRLISAQFVWNKEIYSDWTCYPVDGLPKIGEPVSTDMVNITSYYNMQDGVVYGYADENISAAGGVPVGWYTMDVLGQAFNVSWSGVITHIDDDPCDDSFRILLKYEFYVYKDGWMNVPFGYENPPAFDIQWDGEIGDKFSLDLSLLGNSGFYLVKVSDDVFTNTELIGTTYTQANESGVIYSGVINEDAVSLEQFNGAITIDGGAIAIVYDSDILNTALGVPSGYITNGTYFCLCDDGSDYWYTDRLVAPTRVTKIDNKFIDFDDLTDDLTENVFADVTRNLHAVATTGNYNSLSNRPTVYQDVIRYDASQSLSSSQKSRARTNIDVYSKSEVDSKISSGGSSVPTPTSSDNGKILQVVNGTAKWVSVDIAEEASF